MEYGKLVSVTGLGGLFELVSSKADGALVKNIADGTTKYVSSRSHQFSHLESIEIYTTEENANLLDVFLAMKEAGKALPDSKDNKALQSYFGEVFPQMDFERVYNSDMKKMVRWYEQLQTAGVELKRSEGEAEAESGEEVKKEAEVEVEAAGANKMEAKAETGQPRSKSQGKKTPAERSAPEDKPAKKDA